METQLGCFHFPSGRKSSSMYERLSKGSNPGVGSYSKGLFGSSEYLIFNLFCASPSLFLCNSKMFRLRHHARKIALKNSIHRRSRFQLTRIWEKASGKVFQFAIPLSFRIELHRLSFYLIISDCTFNVEIIKGPRGLGLSVSGGIDSSAPYPGLVRIKRLFPHQAAWATGKLQPGDILLEANGIILTGLTNNVSKSARYCGKRS